MTTPDTCWCTTCRPMRLDDPGSMRMALCPTCGNKRCPRAHNHTLACTNSNDPGQAGSSWEHVRPVRETVVYAPRLAGKTTYLDSELLELAAKAGGYSLSAVSDMIWSDAACEYIDWNPRADDGDSRCLQVVCRISVLLYDNAPPELGLPRSCAVAVAPSGEWFAEAFRPDRNDNEATRLAVLRAAAAIGKAMP